MSVDILVSFILILLHFVVYYSSSLKLLHHLFHKNDSLLIKTELNWSMWITLYDHFTTDDAKIKKTKPKRCKETVC